MDTQDQFAEFAKDLWKDESGQDLVEYALLLVFIALAAIAAVTALGDQVTQIFNDAEQQLSK